MIWTVGIICMVLVGTFALVIGMLLDQPEYSITLIAFSFVRSIVLLLFLSRCTICLIE